MRLPRARSIAVPVVLALVLVMAGAACTGSASGDPPQAEAQPAEEPSSDPADAPEDLLPRPFDAEQIRATMTLGFEADTVTRDASGEVRQRWTVVEWDPEGVVVEYTPLDAAGAPAGEPVRSRSGWVELRDHASFPVGRSTRTREVRDTEFGRLAGWAYTVEDPDVGTRTTFFFADAYPGAPIWMQTRRGDEILMTMMQTRRSDA